MHEITTNGNMPIPLEIISKLWTKVRRQEENGTDNSSSIYENMAFYSDFLPVLAGTGKIALGMFHMSNTVMQVIS